MSVHSEDNQAFIDHDHSHCIEDALVAARAVCATNGARFTRLREQVLTIIWASHQPIGAYAILELLLAANPGQRKPAPPTVYRALDFLLQQGLVHRINSLNAYIGCTHPGSAHHSQFLICTECSTAREFDAGLPAQLVHEAAGADFQIASVLLEVTGLCPQCATGRSQHG